MKFIIILSIVISLVGCKPTSDIISVGELFDIAANELMVSEYSLDPYYDNILNDNKHFKSVQILKDWDILQNETFNLEDKLTNELFESIIYNISFKSLFELGYQNERLNYENVTTIVKKAFKIKNTMSYDYFDTNVQLNDNIKEIKVIDDNYYTDDNIYVGDTIAYEHNNEINYHIVKEIQDDKLILEDASLDDIFSSLDIEGTLDLDLTKAKIRPLYEEEIVFNNDISSVYIKKLSTKKDDYHKFEVKGFTIYYNIKNNRIHVHAVKKNEQNINVFLDLDIYNIKPTIKYKLNDDNYYFRLDFNTSESIGVKYGNYTDLYSDIKSIEPNNFFETLKNSFKSKKEMVDTTIPIMELIIPLPNAPLVNIYLTLQLHIYASGRAELTFSNNNAIGFEIINNKLRPIIENDNDLEFILRASLTSLIGLKTTLEACNIKLCDLAAEGGIKGLMKSSVHILEDDEWLLINNDLPLDVLEQSTKQSNDIKVCGDLSLHWVLNTSFNSFKTMLGKVGLGKTIDFLDEDNQVFLNEYTHIENGLFVPKCTIKGQNNKKPKPTIEITSDRIKVETYNMIIHINENKDIKILGLPQGYKLADLIVTSSNLDVVTTSGLNVKGINRGNSEIKICTNDNKYCAAINILVKK